MKRLRYVRSRYYPIKACVSVLLVAFAAELLIMLVLPSLMPPKTNPFVTAAIDASILTLTIVPIVWWLILRPLSALVELRTRHLNEVFLSIEDERRRVAAELHDSVGQYLTMLVSGLRTATICSNLGEIQGRCRDLEVVARDSLLEVKRITAGLRPSLLDDMGLASAVTRLADDVTRHEGIEITVHCDGLTGKRMSASVETASYRIIQEALNNVVKHAGARSGSVWISLQGGMLVSRIEDDGCGLHNDRGERKANRATGHLGLSGMRERAKLLGGDLIIHSEPSIGTRVVATIPLATDLDSDD